jgi:hypothetical protein
MTQLIDISDFKDVPVIDIAVKAGDALQCASPAPAERFPKSDW